MNAADDKQIRHTNKSSKINGINNEPVACSSKMCAEDNEINPSHLKLNGSAQKNKDSNKHSITNGAYPPSSSSARENGECSGSKKCNSAQVACGEPETVQNETACGESEKGLLLRNSECQKGSDKHLVNNQKQIKPKERSSSDYDRNSSSEDEECCIYTYKGDSNQMADLPSSFFRLDLMPSRPNHGSGNSSPDMDYLEMDFDPGPSNDRYSSSGSECDEGRGNSEHFFMEESSFPRSQVNCEAVPEPDMSPPTPVSPLSTPSPEWCPRPLPSSSAEQPCSSGPASSPPPSPSPVPRQSREAPEPAQPSYCYCIANKHSSTSIDENFNEGDSGTMIWKEQEAREKQVSQIGVSACGATAVINALLGLNVPFTVSAVQQSVGVRLRNQTAPIPEYLFSRSNAGATHVDMIRGLHEVSQNLVYARFFHMFPRRAVFLSSWLSHWIRKGAVPIATVNTQRAARPGEDMPDCWHHQMIYGVSAQGIHLTNPLEVQSEMRLWPQLASPSVLLVRRDDIVSRWTPDTSLHLLIDPQLPLWRKRNVLGQVVNVIRESRSSNCSTQHVTIPASYSSGITLAVLRSNPAYDELRLAPELPVDGFAADNPFAFS